MPGTPFVTVMTDIADCPPHFWIERQEQHLVCGSAKAAEQARLLGHPRATIWRTSGMILHPKFYAPVNIDRAAERRRLGLDPDLPAGLVLFGGQGSRMMLKIAQNLAAGRSKLQLIMLCGRNEELARELRGAKNRIPMCVEGFTSEIPYYMLLADFFIGKPGPGCLSEAVAMGLPVIVERNAWTMPQERYNAEWVVENRLGLAVGSFAQIAPAVEHMLNPANYRRYRAGVASQNNRAVFEAAGILNSILEEPGAQAPAHCA
jgi:1,2-diacylglycerol 3-beta-galactosyltransferase